ncbi:response regulator transcription factor [Oceanimonas smirnovii]|uniref:response regulator transcription factor n=1 Tax=Oceanimonas smirnovii TaxID=264574 RepID=UPI00035E7B78|nr:response regulator transcription factor [Oceanimonas smirnovii]
MEEHKVNSLLIVDDEVMITEELCELFTDHGYRCYSCNDTDTAYQLFCEHKDITIVLSDFHMPGKNGLTLLRDFLELARQSARPVKTILFTGRSEKEDIIKALRLGVSDYYAKPLDMDELLHGVKGLSDALSRASQPLHIDSIEHKLQQLSEFMHDLHDDVAQLRTSQPAREMPVATGTDSAESDALLQELSPRQQAVARLIGKGMTNYQIAVELGLSENTVKLYVSQILRQTRMHNRTQLALALSAL